MTIEISRYFQFFLILPKKTKNIVFILVFLRSFGYNVFYKYRKEEYKMNNQSRRTDAPEFRVDPDAFRERLAQESARGKKKESPAPPAADGKRKPNKKKKKKHGFAKFLCVLLVIVLLLGAVGAGAVFYVTKDYSPSELPAERIAGTYSEPGVKNILLMGVDRADSGGHSRSDTMILLSADTLHGKLKLTSFMRDSYVAIDGWGRSKLTHACSWGGAPLTVDTIERNFGIRIDGYVKVGFELFRDVAEALGGITVPEISEAESRDLAREGVQIAPGKNVHLDGNATLQYCRIRKSTTDFARTERQRRAVSLLIKKALRTNPVKLLSIASDVMGRVESSLTKREIYALALRLLPALAGEIEQRQIPADGTWWDETIDGMWMLCFDEEKNRSILKSYIYG